MNKRLDKKRQRKTVETPSVTLEPVKQPETAVNFYIQYQSQEYLEKDIIERIKEKCKEEGTTPLDLKTLSIYLKPEEQKAYYTFNENGNGFIDL